MNTITITQKPVEKQINDSILKKIKVINSVYKQTYKNKFVSGFGDFLRGCYFTLEFCQKYNLEYHIIILHPINNFLKNKSNTIPQSISDTVEYCEYINYSSDINCSFNPDISSLYHSFFDYLNKQPVYNKNLFLYTVCYPTIQIKPKNKEYIRNLIEPIDEIKESIRDVLDNLQLIKKQFTILHIRSGDQYLTKTKSSLTEEYKEKLFMVINKMIDRNENYLLIADNILVKNFLIYYFPWIKTYFKKIAHLGENSKLDYENTKNTMIDFYILSYGKKIVSISCYEHGSGFSRWSAFTYDVPYMCIKI
jgi:hypothetical protein